MPTVHDIISSPLPSPLPIQLAVVVPRSVCVFKVTAVETAFACRQESVVVLKLFTRLVENHRVLNLMLLCFKAE